MLKDCSSNIKKWACSSVGCLSKNISHVRARIDYLKERRESFAQEEELTSLEISLEKLLSKEEVY